MAHVGQKFRLGPTGRFGRLLGRDQGGEHLPHIAVLIEHSQKMSIALPQIKPSHHGFHIDPCAIGTTDAPLHPDSRRMPGRRRQGKIHARIEVVRMDEIGQVPSQQAVVLQSEQRLGPGIGRQDAPRVIEFQNTKGCALVGQPPPRLSVGQRLAQTEDFGFQIGYRARIDLLFWGGLPEAGLAARHRGCRHGRIARSWFARTTSNIFVIAYPIARCADFGKRRSTCTASLYTGRSGEAAGGVGVPRCVWRHRSRSSQR